MKHFSSVGKENFKSMMKFSPFDLIVMKNFLTGLFQLRKKVRIWFFPLWHPTCVLKAVPTYSRKFSLL
jgi:hypothetical protein